PRAAVAPRPPGPATPAVLHQGRRRRGRARVRGGGRRPVPVRVGRGDGEGVGRPVGQAGDDRGGRRRRAADRGGRLRRRADVRRDHVGGDRAAGGRRVPGQCHGGVAGAGEDVGRLPGRRRRREDRVHPVVL